MDRVNHRTSTGAEACTGVTKCATRHVELGSGRARWLAAAAFDRWLMSEGKPQKFGAQYRVEGCRWVLHEVDAQTTDEDRADWNVPPLEVALARAEQMTQEHPPAL